MTMDLRDYGPLTAADKLASEEERRGREFGGDNEDDDRKSKMVSKPPSKSGVSQTLSRNECQH